MKFYIDINVKDIPTIGYSSDAKGKCKEMSSDQGDLLLTVESNFAREICTRDGYRLEDKCGRKGPGSVVTLCFDDFTAEGSNHPWWYHLLRNRIISTQATEQYGSGQGIAVTEEVTYGSAIAKVRHQQADWGQNGEVVYVVKISAKGNSSLDDAISLHHDIINTNPRRRHDRYKIFPETHDGDQISVAFEYEPEKNAFETVLYAIRKHLDQAEPEKEGGKEVFSDFKLETTLQANVVERYSKPLCKIIGLHVVNIYYKDNIMIVRYTE